MTQAGAPIRHADRFFIGGQWVRRRRMPRSASLTPTLSSCTSPCPKRKAADIDRRSPPQGSVRRRPMAVLTHAQPATGGGRPAGLDRGGTSSPPCSARR